MSNQSIPQIPPRPSRSQEQQQQGGATLGSEIPRIPPRPANKRIDRSQSPNGDRYARSPLNEPNFIPGASAHGKSGLYSSSSANASSSSLALPSIGQEGSEYADFHGAEEQLATSPTQTRNIANDLTLHAPKASLTANAAKQRVSTVTRTDSDQAAAFGLGKARGDDGDPQSRTLKSKTSSVSMNSSSGAERPVSSADDGKHGIPIHGQRVPMYPNAGDVQAPSPSPFTAQFPVGVGFHNDGSKPRHHGRRTSARGFDAPPGAYGLHGHGVQHTDRFEQDYYRKHPELLKKETPHYQEERAGWAMSSEDLNKIVRDTASRGAGMGASDRYASTPSEQIGFMASEQYASRTASPRPSNLHKQASSVSSQTHVDSHLRRESFNVEDTGKAELEHVVAQKLGAPSETALESDGDDVVHVGVPAHRVSKIYGGAGHIQSTEDLGPQSEFRDEHGYDAPILASDEVAKEPFGYELQPAVSPMQERHRSQYEGEGLSLYRTHSGQASQPSSRPVSIHNAPSLRHQDYDGHSTPLEDLEEYEPLFPEEEAKKAAKPLTAADKLKARPDLKSRKFPSQDVWEDTPASLNYTTTVSHDQEPEETEEGQFMRNLKVREGETAAQAFARQQEELAEKESRDSESFLHRERKPQAWAKNKNLVSEVRPNLSERRFPSRDVWEDNPDSLMLQTTVAGPQQPIEAEVLSPPDERPTTGAVTYQQEKAAAGFALGQEEGRATTGIAAIMKPSIPARPTRAKPASSATSPTESREKPVVPVSSKPSVPARPVKAPVRQGSTEDTDLTRVTSAGSTKSVGSDTSSATVAALKAKPPVPSRPVGSKIAALQGGFMADLNKKLGLGPQAPKEADAEPENDAEPVEKAPLADARKSRARGPQRRAPAKSPTPAETASSSALSFSTPTLVFAFHPDGDLLVGEQATEAEELISRDTKAAHDITPTLATNTAGEALHAPAEIANGAATSSSQSSAVQDQHAREIETARKHDLIDSLEADGGDRPLKPSEAPEVTRAEEEEEEKLSGSTATLKPVTSNKEAKYESAASEVVHEQPLAESLSAGVHETPAVEKMPGGFGDAE